MKAVSACPDVFSFDRDMVATYHGYEDVWAYYADMSVGMNRQDGTVAHPERRPVESKMSQVTKPMLVVRVGGHAQQCGRVLGGGLSTSHTPSFIPAHNTAL